MPQPLSAMPDLRFVALVGQARASEVVLYVGAGVSIGSGLPSGAKLAELVYAKASASGVDLTGISATNLLAVADAAEAANEGDPSVIQEIALGVADFTQAPPAATHVALALLLLEGAALVMSTNWDTCIERAAPSNEPIAPIVTDDDRMSTRGVSLFKVHGCARRPNTALVTSNQLAATPIWASSELSAKLSHASVVFVGIGDVAPYVALRIEKLIAQMGSAENVSVVSRSIVSKWSKSEWAKVASNLAESHKIPADAEDFLDDFLRAWVQHCFERLREISTGLGNPDLHVALGALLTTLVEDTAPNVLAWLRRSWAIPTAGRSAVHDPHSHEALLALASWTKGDSIAKVPHSGPAQSNRGAIDIHIQPGTPGPVVAKVARARVAAYRTSGVLSPDDPVTVLCSGQIGPLEPSTHALLEQNVVAAEDAGNVITGPELGPVGLVAAHAVLEGSIA